MQNIEIIQDQNAAGALASLSTNNFKAEVAQTSRDRNSITGTARSGQSCQITAKLPTAEAATELSSGQVLQVNADQAVAVGCPAAVALLLASWPLPTACHQLAIMDRSTKQWQHISIPDLEAGVEQALSLSKLGKEVYFACAEYKGAGNRRADNVLQASTFHLDLDCGEQKAADGKGFPDSSKAKTALADFCTTAGLPDPNLIVDSGGGLHVYFGYDKPLDPVTWKLYADKLKALAKAMRFPADPSRTSDIASVLRVPGTLNHKYSPPKPVSLLHAGPAISRVSLLQAIDAAYSEYCNSPVEQLKPAAPTGTGAVRQATDDFGAPDLESLASALKLLNPDADDFTWKFHRLAPLANAAQQWPNLAVELESLARRWSSGDLQGLPSVKWIVPSETGGPTGEDAFAGVWQRLLTGRPNGRPATIGTIYHAAQELGWKRRTDAIPPTKTGAGAVDDRLQDARIVINGVRCKATANAGMTPKDGLAMVPRSNVALRLEPLSFPDQPVGNGRLLPSTITNTKHLLATHGITVRYNVIAKKLQIKFSEQAGPIDLNVAVARIQSLAALNALNLPNLAGYLGAIGDDEQFNPMEDWIRSEPWDGVDRLASIYATLVERAGFPTTLKQTLVYRWLLSLVAASLLPTGFRSRGVLTLQGAQSIGKTSWIRSLISNQHLREELIKLDHHLDPHNKDSLSTAVEHSILEIGELDSSFKKDIAHLKGFITSGTDKFRRPYDKFNSEYPRRTVFCASVNDDNFLVDPTGNTRFWTIPVTSIDHSHQIDMQQVYAQLAEDLRSGAQWWLTPIEESELEVHNSKHVTVSAVRELLLENLDFAECRAAPVRMTASQVLRALQIAVPTTGQVRECGAILKEFLGTPVLVHKTNAWLVSFRQIDLDQTPAPAVQQRLPGVTSDVLAEQLDAQATEEIF